MTEGGTITLFYAWQTDLDELSHPLLGEESTLRLLPDPSEVTGVTIPRHLQLSSLHFSQLHTLMHLYIEDCFVILGLGNSRKSRRWFDGWFQNSRNVKTGLATTIPMKVEPKTFFANERTFLSWLHMVHHPPSPPRPMIHTGCWRDLPTLLIVLSFVTNFV